MKKNIVVSLIIATLVILFFFLQAWILSYYDLYNEKSVLYPTFLFLFPLVYYLSIKISIKNNYIKALLLFSILLACHSFSDILLVWFYGGTLANNFHYFEFMSSSWIPIILFSLIPLLGKEFNKNIGSTDDIIDDELINKS